MIHLGITVPLLALTLLLAVPAGAFEVTGCDQEVPEGETGFLTTDLHCWSPLIHGTYNVAVGHNATLDLQGHTLEGSYYSVYCRGRCTITSSTAARGIIRGSWYGLYARAQKGRTRVSNMDFLENSTGIVATNLTMQNVGFVDNWGGAAHMTDNRKLVGENVTVSGCAEATVCIGSGKIRLTGFTFVGSSTPGTIVAGKTVRLTGGSITGATVAIRDDAGPKLKDFVLSGNGIDIVSARRPRLPDSTCETSQDLAGIPWGVCTND